MKEVTKEDFLKVYNEYAPNLFLRIMFKHFSTSLKKSLGTKIMTVLFIVFTILAIIFQETQGQSAARNISMIIAYGPFSLWCITAFIAFKWNQLRNRKIAKILGLTKNEYDALSTRYVTEE